MNSSKNWPGPVDHDFDHRSFRMSVASAVAVSSPRLGGPSLLVWKVTQRSAPYLKQLLNPSYRHDVDVRPFLPAPGFRSQTRRELRRVNSFYPSRPVSAQRRSAGVAPQPPRLMTIPAPGAPPHHVRRRRAGRPRSLHFSSRLVSATASESTKSFLPLHFRPEAAARIGPSMASRPEGLLGEQEAGSGSRLSRSMLLLGWLAFTACWLSRSVLRQHGPVVVASLGSSLEAATQPAGT